MTKSHFPRIALCAASLIVSSAQADEAPSTMGAQIYSQQCARCHGADGQGTEDEYPQALTGDRSIPELTRYIAKSMPPDRDEKCSAGDAAQVAGFIFESFYSKDAQARRQRPRLQLARLTASQYRHTIADLIAGFRRSGPVNDRRGLVGDYFTTSTDNGGQHVLTQVDPQIRFNFGKESPIAEKIGPREFGIYWSGALRAPETGEYEITLRTENSARLLINGWNRPLINAWVKSGNDTEFRSTIRLLGGRVYPLRLEYSKAGQGVRKSKEELEKEPIQPAGITLEWKLSKRVPEAIPQRFLIAASLDEVRSTVPETLIVETPFPPDDRSLGFERGTSVSREWHQATTDAAIEVADYVIEHLRELANVPDVAPEHRETLQNFCLRFAERAFRRPLSDEQRESISRLFATASDLETGVQRVVISVLTSPRFLYHDRGSAGTDAYDTAARLSYTLWNSPPDAPLLQAAAEGKLQTPDQISEQARRMSRDLRASQRLKEFLLQWMKLDNPRDLLKDPTRFPEFNTQVASDLRTSLELALDEFVHAEAPEFRQLFLSEALYLNGRLAKFFGVNLPEEAPFQPVAANDGVRAGMLTHPYLLATFASAEASSPIHRGVFLGRNVLGRLLKPPPDAFEPLPVSLHPDLTTRERVVLQTKAEGCMSCHGLINPLGFALERFDALGRYRVSDNGRPINSTGEYMTRRGETQSFSSARELGKFLAESEEPRDALIDKLFHELVKQPLRAYGPETAAQLRQQFDRSQGNLRDLLAAIATAATQVPPVAATGP